ncbi:MAG: prepilin-type N-terminal cleavage/methylation domain-containing protein [Myxococcales bacterium]|nr:prepilin-type N-terminal cleavage/methylation domain-containing protein [Myxococcales bacterium]
MRARYGFTLVELMIAVAIIGVLASVAVPAFQGYIQQSKASEGSNSLGLLYLGAVSYWETPTAAQGLGATSFTHCTVDESAPLPPVPFTQEKRTADFSSDANFVALGFTPAEPVGMSYWWNNAVNSGGVPWPYCGADDTTIYVFFAGCDFDGDGRAGGMALEVFATSGHLRRSPGLITMKQYADSIGFVMPGVVDGID